MKKFLIILLLGLILSDIYAQKKVISIPLTKNLSIDMVLIKPDTFVRKNFYGDTIRGSIQLMPIVQKGAYNGISTIILSDYYIAKFEVTRELYYYIMKQDPSDFKNTFKTNDTKCPVQNVTWYDAVTFIDSLNAITGKHFRLPTEAEWDYAAWGGNPRLKYSGSDTCYKVAWIGYEGYPHPVGGKMANGYGLYDMTGNITEWCSDWFSSYYYLPDSTYINPKGPDNGDFKVVKGGSWGGAKRALELNTRVGYRPKRICNGSGFRLAMDAE